MKLNKNVIILDDDLIIDYNFNNGTEPFTLYIRLYDELQQIVEEDILKFGRF